MVMSIFTESWLSQTLTETKQELASLKTIQKYSTGQVASSKNYSVFVDSYTITVPGDVSGWGYDITRREVAATLLFTGADETKNALGVLDVTPAINSIYNQIIWQAFMPTDKKNQIKVGVLWRMEGGGGLNINITTNMPGVFVLERTYTVFIT